MLRRYSPTGKYLVPLARGGGGVGRSLALTEACSGSDAAALETMAILKKGQWVINGGKSFITQGSTAGIYVIMAKTNREKGAKGILAFVVEKATSGLSGRKA